MWKVLTAGIVACRQEVAGSSAGHGGGRDVRIVTVASLDRRQVRLE